MPMPDPACCPNPAPAPDSVETVVLRLPLEFELEGLVLAADEEAIEGVVPRGGYAQNRVCVVSILFVKQGVADRRCDRWLLV